MSLSGDDILEASLLAIVLGEEPDLLEAPEAASLLEHPEIPEPTEASE